MNLLLTRLYMSICVVWSFKDIRGDQGGATSTGSEEGRSVWAWYESSLSLKTWRDNSKENGSIVQQIQSPIWTPRAQTWSKLAV